MYTAGAHHTIYMNEQQIAAAHSPGHLPLLLIAGPGSGKTRVLTHRVSYLLRRSQAHGVLCLSFSRASCQTFQERIKAVLTPQEIARVRVCTFHSLCLRLCRENPSLLGLSGTQPFRLVSTTEQVQIAKACLEKHLKEHTSSSNSSSSSSSSSNSSSSNCSSSSSNSHNNASNDAYTPSSLVARVDRAKAELRSPEDYSTEDPLFQKLFRSFVRTMHADNALSFLDCVVKALSLLRCHPMILNSLQKQYTHLLCDEFQDTSRLQFNLLSLVGGHGRVSLFLLRVLLGSS